MTTTKVTVIGLLGLAALAASVMTCGGGVTTANDTRESARDKATTATCMRYDSCGLINGDAGAAYATYDSCTTVWRANWETRWPVTTCTKINEPGLNVCLSAIAATSCDSILDFLATLAKCEEVDVCAGAVDGGDQGQ